MRVRNLIVPCAAFTAFFAFLPAAPAYEPGDIVGTYQCVGDAGDGKHYEGKVEIAQTGDCYAIKWNLGRQAYTGLAVRDGDTLAAAIHDDADPKYTGVIIYRLSRDGKLYGRWSAAGLKGQVLTETLTPAPTPK